MMTKKDFIALANHVAELHVDYESETGVAIVNMSDLINELVRFCRASNPRFDEDRFRVHLEQHKI